MKSYLIILFLLSVLLFACNDDLTDIGVGIRPISDSISTSSDTFYVSSQNVFVPYIISRPDSFLLGSFYDEKFGTTQADILAQLEGPINENLKYLQSSVPDSAIVRMYYNSWIGDGYSTMDVNIYEMKGEVLVDSISYKTNLDLSRYCGQKIWLGRKIFSAIDASSTTTSKIISVKLDSAFKNRFLKDKHLGFTSDTSFLNYFKGLYITSNFGSSTLINIGRIDLEYYSHYDYYVPGSDTLKRASNMLTFPANKWVRQVNRFMHPDSSAIKQKLALIDSVNYVSSPANVHTKVVLPLKRIQDRIKAKIQDKLQTLNSALLNVEVTDVDDRLFPQPVVKYMLLIRKSSIDRFFSKGELPSDTCAILAPYTPSLISNTSLYKSYYTFNVAKLMANEFKLKKNINDNYEMMLVPVSVTFDGSNNVTAVKQEFLMSSVIFRSGKNTLSPMRINMVYSGL